MLGDTARRGASRRRALQGPDRQERRSCRWSAAGSRSSPTTTPIPEKGTGAVKITPAHDFNDFEVGKRHELAADQHLRRRGRLALNGNEASRRPAAARAASPRRRNGIDRFAARKQSSSGWRPRPAGQDRAEHPHGAARRPLGRRDRALSDRPVVRQRQDAGAAGDRGGARGPHQLRARGTGRRPTSSGWRTSSPGASRASSGGATRFPPGTGRTARSSSPRPRRKPTAMRSAITPSRAPLREEQGREMALDRNKRAASSAGRGRARHLVLLGAVAVLDARLAGRDAGADALSIRPTSSSPASTSSSSGSPG